MSVLGWRFGGANDPTVGGMTYTFLGASGSLPTLHRAGVIGDAASIVTISAIWTPTVATPSPYVGYAYGTVSGQPNVLSIQLATNDAYGYSAEGFYGNACEGLLELTATVDGIDASNKLVIAFINAAGYYGDAAFGYASSEPSLLWTNIRQARET